MKLLTSSTVGNVIIFLPSILTLHVCFREYSCIISCIKLSHGIKNCSSFITWGYICISQLSSEHVAFRAQQNAVADYTIKSNDVALTKMEIFSTPSLLVICDGAKGIFEMLQTCSLILAFAARLQHFWSDLSYILVDICHSNWRFQTRKWSQSSLCPQFAHLNHTTSHHFETSCLQIENQHVFDKSSYSWADTWWWRVLRIRPAHDVAIQLSMLEVAWMGGVEGVTSWPCKHNHILIEDCLGLLIDFWGIIIEE